MSLIIDSSVALAWYFEDEKTDESTAILHRVEGGAVVPMHWRLEVANGLQVAVRRRRIDLAYRNASLNELQSLAIAIDPGTNRQAWSATLQLSDRYRLTLYDAAYLELALRLRFPLATLDGDLARAAHAEGVPLVEGR